jgi:hypothetical protein
MPYIKVPQNRGNACCLNDYTGHTFPNGDGERYSTVSLSVKNHYRVNMNPLRLGNLDIPGMAMYHRERLSDAQDVKYPSLGGSIFLYWKILYLFVWILPKLMISTDV